MSTAKQQQPKKHRKSHQNMKGARRGDSFANRITKILRASKS